MKVTTHWLFIGLACLATAAPPALAQQYRLLDDAQGGDCQARGIGAWDPASKTCTLSASLTGTISIDDNGITLDGRGLQLRAGPGAIGNGITVRNRQDVTIKRLTLLGFDPAILIQGGTSNTVEKVTVTPRPRMRFGIIMEDTSECKVWKSTRVSSAADAGIWLRWSHRCTVSDNNLFQNQHGIMLTDANFNTLDNNLITGSGLPLGSGINVLSGNDNTLSKNRVSGSKRQGIFIGDGHRNSTFFNTVSNNVRSGYMHIVGRDNRIFCNDFQGHNLGVEVWDINNNIWWNNFYANDDAQDLIGQNRFNFARPTGGNYWKRNSANCTDANNDRFCDQPHVFVANQDNLPHVRPIPWVNQPDICLQGGFAMTKYGRQEIPQYWYTSLTGMIEALLVMIGSGDSDKFTELFAKNMTLIENNRKTIGRDAAMAALSQVWACGTAAPSLVSLGELSAEQVVTEIHFRDCTQKPKKLLVSSRYQPDVKTRIIESMDLTDLHDGR